MVKLLVPVIGLFTVGVAAGSILASQYGNAVVSHRSLPTMPRRINGRAGTGPSGFLSVDDTPYDDISRNIKLAGGDDNVGAGSSPGVIASAGVAGTFTTCLPIFAVRNVFSLSSRSLLCISPVHIHIKNNTE